ncbi:MAG: response regulator transcription factor [Burkholderiales bacterium]|nr:response regulator transcription factor [Burkholderiales bacterium]
MTSGDTVYLVDDEPELTRALARLLQAEGLAVRAFNSAADFLATVAPEDTGCVVLDLAMPGLDGLALQQRLAHLPGLAVVFLTGHGDIPTSVRAIKAGAVDFLTKPVRRDDLMRAVRASLGVARVQAAVMRADADARVRLARLTPREREVFEHVIAGRLNKLIADRLGTSEHTVKVHRGRVMAKLGAGSVADLVRLAQRLGIAPAT